MYNQSEIDLLFNTIVIPNINYTLSVYAASESDLTPVQCFLDRCFIVIIIMSILCRLGQDVQPIIMAEQTSGCPE